VKAIDLPRAGHHCLPGGRERRAATIRVHPPPRCPPPPSRLAAATPTMCRGESSPLAMKRSIRTVSARTPPYSPLQFSQPASPPNLLFARLIFQSGSYTFSTPNFPLTKKKGHRNDPVYLLGAHNYSQNIPFFLEGVLELLSRDIICPSWKYDIGRIFKITRWFLTPGIW